MRYCGQSTEITVPIAPPLIETELRAAEARFEVEFERTYGHRGQNKEFELVTCRMIASVIRHAEHSAAWAAEPGGGAAQAERLAYFGPRYGALPTPVVHRTGLRAQARPGPLIVQEYDTSVIVPPDCTITLDAHNNIAMNIGVE